MSWTKVNSSKLSARKNSVWSSKLSLCKENLFWVMKFKIDSPRWYIFWVSILELLTELKTPKVFWIVCTCTGKIRIEIIWGKASLPPPHICTLRGEKAWCHCRHMSQHVDWGMSDHAARAQILGARTSIDLIENFNSCQYRYWWPTFHHIPAFGLGYFEETLFGK